MINLSLEWKTVELKSIANVTMGQSPKSEFYNDNFEGMPFLQGNKTFGDKYPSFELYTTSIKKVAEKSSVLMSVRAPVGDLNIAQEDICIGRGVCGLQMKKGDNEFLYYLLKANISHLINKESGTVFGSINKNDIETFEVTLPEDSKDQQKILTILKNIDKKIEVSKELNKNLHLQRKELFKHWFIDFSSSNYELIDTAFGLIPKSWNIYDFKEILTKRTEKSNDVSIPMFSVTNTGIHPREDKFNKKLSASSSKFKLIYKNDLVFGMSREILNWGLMEEKIGGVSSAYHIFKINKDLVNPFYLKGFIENYMFYFKDIIKPASREGQGIDQNVLFIKQIYVPPENIFKEFYQIDIHFNNFIELNNNQIEKLICLRDTLLPKLMSGEIDVSDIN